MNKQLSEFGEVFITSVRDNTLFTLEGIISGHMKSPSDRKLHDRLKTLSNEQIQILKEFSYKMVDLSLHNTLFFFEQQEDWIISNDEKEVNNLNEISDGLTGELYSDEGWIEKFSKYPPSPTL